LFLQFIFFNYKIIIHSYNNLATIGVMNIVITNVCVWIRTIILESEEEYHHYSHEKSNLELGIYYLF
jgi:hypothetical protein